MHIFLFAVLPFLSYSVSTPIEALQSSIRVSFYGSIDYETNYVYVQDGEFRNGGKEIRFFGVNYESLMRPDLWDSSWIAPSQDEFKKMREYNFNLIRLNINWRILEPTPNSYDTTYLGYIDNIVNWCKANSIYVYFNIHFFGQDQVAPLWISTADKYSDMVNRSTTKQLVNVWGMLADRYKNETYVFGYDVPINEVEILTSQEMFSKEPDISKLWQGWLKRKFSGDLSALNSTWNWSIYDQLGPGEDSFDHILFPRIIRGYGEESNFDARRPTYTEFRWEWWYNLTRDCIDTIKSIDYNHLCIAEVMGGGDQGAIDVCWTPQLRVPKGVDGIDRHSYPSWTSTFGFERNTTVGLNGETSTEISRWATISKSLSIPFIVGEAGHVMPMKDYSGEWSGNWTGEICTNSYKSGAKAILLYTWNREGAPAYGLNNQLTLIYDNMTFRDKLDWLPEFAGIFKQSKDYNPKADVALVDLAFGVDWSMKGWLYCLNYLHVNPHVLSQKTLLDNSTAVLDLYKLVICSPDRLSPDAIKLIKKWNQQSSNHKVLWLGSPDRDECINPQSWKQWEEWMLNGQYTIDNSGRRNITLRVTNRSFGNLNENVELTFRTPSSFMNIGVDSINGLVGCEPRIMRGDRFNQVALWTVNDTAAWFFSDVYARGCWGYDHSDDYTFPPQESMLTILNAILDWARISIT